MIDVVVEQRVVVVLGRGPIEDDPSRSVARAAERGDPLVVLTLGYPATDGQQAFVERAIDAAFAARVHLDARIVSQPGGLAEHIGASDDVTVVASGREQRQIGSGLARRSR